MRSSVAGVLATVGVLVTAVALSGCSSAENKPAKQQPVQQQAAAAKSAAEPQPMPQEQGQAAPEAKTEAKAQPETPETELTQETEETEEMNEKPRDLGQPLVDDPGKLVRLDPKEPVWVDRENKQVVLLGQVCKAGYPLEFFATYSNRSYEAVMAINVKPSIVHAGLLAVGAVPGHPAQFQPEFLMPTGTEVAIEVRWKDDKGKVQSAPAQHWIRNIETQKELDVNWVFAGSLFMIDDTTGKKYYQADSGELICVLSLPNAMLDLPIRSYGAIESRAFEAFAEHLPPTGTPTTVVLKPILTSKAEKPAE